MTLLKIFTFGILLWCIFSLLLIVIAWFFNWEISINIPIFVGIITIFSIVTSFLPPEKKSGLKRGQRLYIKKSFSSGNSEFIRGDIVEFMGERLYLPTDEYDFNPEHDLYDFKVIKSKEELIISSTDYKSPNMWLKNMELIK